MCCSDIMSLLSLGIYNVFGEVLLSSATVSPALLSAFCKLDMYIVHTCSAFRSAFTLHVFRFKTLFTAAAGSG